MRSKSKETTVNIKSWLNVMCGLMWGNSLQMSHCHIKASLLFGGRFCKCLESKRPSSTVGIFPWLPPSLSPATVRLHNLRKLMVLGMRSSCWQALISESVLMVHQSSTHLTCMSSDWSQLKQSRESLSCSQSKRSDPLCFCNDACSFKVAGKGLHK